MPDFSASPLNGSTVVEDILDDCSVVLNALGDLTSDDLLLVYKAYPNCLARSRQELSGLVAFALSLRDVIETVRPITAPVHLLDDPAAGKPAWEV